MSEGQQEDFDVEDALTTEEELLLKHEAMRDFFLQQLKGLRDSMVSFQTKMQEDLKACREATEQNFTEELKSSTKRTHGLVRTDLQLLEENIQKTENRFGAKIRAMEESMSHRMNLMESKLEGMSSRLVKMDVDICGALASTSVEPTSSLLGDLLNVDTALESDRPSAKSEALATTSVSDLPHEPEVIFISRCEPSQSPTGHPQGATSTTQLRTGASLPQRSLIPYLRPVAENAALASRLVSDVVDDEAFIDLLTSPQFPSHQPQRATSTPLSSDASLRDRPVALDGGDDSWSSFQSSPLPDTSGLLKKKCKRKHAQTLQELEPELASKVKPHVRKMTRQEKLSGIQSAYFSFQMERLNITDTKDLMDKAEIIKAAGERDGVWSPDWCPRGCKDMHLYLAEKIKSALKKKRISQTVVQEEWDKLLEKC